MTEKWNRPYAFATNVHAVNTVLRITVTYMKYGNVDNDGESM